MLMPTLTPSNTFALTVTGKTKNRKIVRSRSGNISANAAINPNNPADAPTIGM